MKKEKTWFEFPSNDLELRCEGTYRRGSPERFDSKQMQWYPGDPEEIEDFAVYLTKGKGPNLEKLQITDWLSEKQVEKLELEFLECCRADDE